MKRDVRQKPLLGLPHVALNQLTSFVSCAPHICQQALLATLRHWHYVLELGNVLFESIKCNHTIWVPPPTVGPQWRPMLVR